MRNFLANPICRIDCFGRKLVGTRVVQRDPCQPFKHLVERRPDVAGRYAISDGCRARF
jgi:hypothetical protein